MQPSAHISLYLRRFLQWLSLKGRTQHESGSASFGIKGPRSTKLRIDPRQIHRQLTVVRSIGACSRNSRIESTRGWMTMKPHADSFDYVVVGAGSAGCVLANRLTASGRHRVLLLEAGCHDRHLWIHIPLGYGKLFSDSKVNWLYTSEPEAELNNRQIIQPRGKVLGGSSSINGLLYIRGQPSDCDHWRKLGKSGWSFEDVLPYFRRAEDQARGEDALHGVGGPLAVSDVCEPHPLCEAFIAAAQQAGFPRNDDFNGPTQEGAGYF